MNILFYVSKFPVVSETFIRDQIIGLINKGHNIFIYVHKKDEIPEKEALKGFENYDLLNKVVSDVDFMPRNKVIRFIQFIYLFIKISFTSKNKKAYYISLNFKKYGYKAKSLLLFFKIYFMEYNKIDLIHAHFGYNGEKATIFKELGCKLKLITTFHGNDIRLGLIKGGYDTLKHYGTHFISISNYNYQSLKKMNFDTKKIRSINNGVNTEFFKRNRIETSKKINILTVARLVEEKNIDLALQAISKIVKMNTSLHIVYTIIGDGGLKNELVKSCKDLKIEKNVIFVGAVNSEKVRDYMLKSDLFLLTSRKEALPTVILEAKSCSLPVVSSDVGAIRQMFSDDSYIFKNENLDDLVIKLNKLLNNRQFFLEIGNNNRVDVENNFSLKRHLEKLIRVYEE